MSLYLPEQKLGSRSGTDSSSHKFMLKGRQTGSMHRGHAWVFRAESRDTMLAWYDDIMNLTEKTGEERNAFLRQHARSVSGGSHKPASISSDGAMDEDEADQVPYSATASQVRQPMPEQDRLLKRPQPGGRFPSDLNVNRNLLVPLSPSSGASSDDSDIIATAGAPSGSDVGNGHLNHPVQSKENTTASVAFPGGVSRQASTHAKDTPTAQNFEHIDLQEQPAIHGSTQQTPATRSATQPRPTHEGTPSRALSRDLPRDSSHYDSYIPIQQKAEYNNLPVHEGAYVYPQQESVTEGTASERAPHVLRDTSPHVPIAPQTEYVGVPVIHGAPEPQQQLAASQALPQQISVEQASNQEALTRLGVEYNNQPVQAQGLSSEGPGAVSYGSPQSLQSSAPRPRTLPPEPVRHDSTYGDWIGPKASGVAGVEASSLGAEGFRRPQEQDPTEHKERQSQVLQQPQSEPAELDSTTSGPTNLSGLNGTNSYSSSEGLEVNRLVESNIPAVSATISTPKANGPSTHAGETHSTSGAQNSRDVNTALATQFPRAEHSRNDTASDGAEPHRPVTAADEILSPRVGHFHIPGEFPPTPTM